MRQSISETIKYYIMYMVGYQIENHTAGTGENIPRIY